MPDAESTPDLVPSRLIRAILPKGVAIDVLRMLREEKDIVAANVVNARGTGRFTHRTLGGVASSEREVLSVIVPASRSDEIFSFVFERAGVGQPHGGVMFQVPVPQATVFRLPDDVPDEGR